MTRSIFDPTGPNTERSGSQNLGPDAGNRSRMPSSITDGKVSEEEAQDLELIARANQEEQPDDVRLAEAHTGDNLGTSIAAGAVPTGSATNDPDASTTDPRNELSNPGRDTP